MVAILDRLPPRAPTFRMLKGLSNLASVVFVMTVIPRHHQLATVPGTCVPPWCEPDVDELGASVLLFPGQWPKEKDFSQ